MLFNNAGIFGPAALIDEMDPADFRRVLEVNLTGMFLCARAAFARMRGQARGAGGSSTMARSRRTVRARIGLLHGHQARDHRADAVAGLDGRAFDIACGQIDIGNARTEIVAELNARALERDPDAPLMTMDVADAARSVWHMATMPPEANVQFMTVMATKMPYIGRG